MGDRKHRTKCAFFERKLCEAAPQDLKIKFCESLSSFYLNEALIYYLSLSEVLIPKVVDFVKGLCFKHNAGVLIFYLALKLN